MSEIWFRNPHTYVKELAEVGGQALIAWDRGILVKRRIDPVMHAKVYFGSEADFRLLAIGPQGSAELDKDHDLDNPKAVYPTWEYGEDFNILEEMVASPLGQDVDACSDLSVPADQRPVWGQEHRVIVSNLPNAAQPVNRPFYRHLQELQEEYPDCILHLHGSYSFRIMFGMGYASADFEPRTDAANGQIFIPAGKKMPFAKAIGHLQWLNLLDTSITDLKVPRNRCMFNIKSARWASEHFTEDIKFKSRGTANVDPDSPKTVIPTTAATRTQLSLSPQQGDKIVCDDCSLSSTCKLYREGAVCSVRGSETNALAKMFNSRDSGNIIDGLGTILAAQTERLQRGMESEEEFGELDPEVTKIMNQLFANGVKLAKLVDPTLTKPMVQINNGGAAAVGAANPKEFAASVVRALENSGIKREDITPELFQGMVQKMTGNAPQPQAIQGQIVSE